MKHRIHLVKKEPPHPPSFGGEFGCPIFSIFHIFYFLFPISDFYISPISPIFYFHFPILSLFAHIFSISLFPIFSIFPIFSNFDNFPNFSISSIFPIFSIGSIFSIFAIIDISSIYRRSRAIRWKLTRLSCWA